MLTLEILQDMCKDEPRWESLRNVLPCIFHWFEKKFWKKVLKKVLKDFKSFEKKVFKKVLKKYFEKKVLKTNFEKKIEKKKSFFALVNLLFKR